MKDRHSLLLSALFAILMLLVASCASSPQKTAPEPAPAPAAQPEPAPPPPSPPPATTVTTTPLATPPAAPSISFSNPSYQKVYNAYRGLIDMTGAKKYKVKWRDRLANIARRQYNSKANSYYYPLIMLASDGVIQDPDLIIGGTTITIPDLQRNLDTPEKRANVRALLLECAKILNEKKAYPRTAAGLRATAEKLK